MATIKTNNSTKIELGTIYTKNGKKCAKEQLWWDLPINQNWNPQNDFTKFYFTNSNFDKIVFRWKNNTKNCVSSSNSNILYLDGNSNNASARADEFYSKPDREAIFWMEKDKNGDTIYEFAGVFDHICYDANSDLHTFIRAFDTLECEF